MDSEKPMFNADEAEEYFTMLCTSYRDTANDIFKRDNEGRHASEHIWSAEYQKYLGMQIAMREVLEYFSKFELGKSTQQPNAPLTMTELRQMDGEPVWIVWSDGRIKSKWWIVGSTDWRMMDFGEQYAQNDYGRVWLAYRRKPEEGTI